MTGNRKIAVVVIIMHSQFVVTLAGTKSETNATLEKVQGVLFCSTQCNCPTANSCSCKCTNCPQATCSCSYDPKVSIFPRVTRACQDGPSPGPAPPPTPPGPPPAPPSPLPMGAIRSRSSTKRCLDLPGGSTSNGNRLWVWDCTGSNNQQWYVGSNGQISPASNRQKCIDLPGNNYQNGNQLHIWDCHGLPQQKWGYDANLGSIYLASSSADATKCIDVSWGGQNNGAPVQIWDCHGSDWNQKFDVWPFGAVARDTALLS